MAETIRGINVVIGAETTGLQKALSDVNKASRDIQSELRQVERLLKMDPKNTELLAQKQKLLSEAVSTTREKLDRLKAAQEQVNEQFKKGEISEGQYRAFQREVAKTEQELKKLEDQARKTGLNLDEIGESMQKAGDKLAGAGKQLSTKVTAPILAIGAAAAKIGMDFESSMAQVRAFSGASAEEMAALEKAARDAGATTSKSASDAADALGYMALAGWDTKTSMEGLMPVLRLSEAGKMDLAKASSLVTDSMSAMGIEVDDLAHYLDIVAQTARSSNTNIDQMAEAYINVGGTLRGLNVPLEDSALALGFLANAGIKGSEAGRALNAVMINLTAPTGRAKEALDALNFSAFDSSGQFKGMEQVLFELQGKMAGMTEEQRNNALAMIGGKQHVKDLNALLNGLDDSYDGLKASIAAADGALEDVAKTMQTSNKGSLIELSSALEEVALKIYDVLKPSIAAIVDALKGFVDMLNKLSPEQQEMIVKIGMIVAAIGPALLIIGKLVAAVGTIISAFSAASGAITAAGGAISAAGGVIGLLTNPITIAIAAIGTLVAAGIYVWQNWDTIKEKLSAIWQAISDFATSVWDGITSYLSDAWDSISQTAQKVWDGIKAFFAEWWETLLAVFGGPVGWLVLLVVKNWDEIKRITTETWNAIKQFFSDTWEGIKNIFGLPIEWLLTTISDAWQTITGGVESAWEGITNFFSNTWEGIKKTFDNAFGDMIRSALEFGKGIMESLKKGIGSIKIPIPKISIEWKSGPLDIKIPKLNIGADWKALADLVPFLADGGIVTRQMLAVVGEKGPEAVIPLNQLRSIFSDLLDEQRAKNELQSRLATAGGPELHLHIGTLVADDLGLKRLEQTLRKYRVAESQRVGV